MSQAVQQEQVLVVPTRVFHDLGYFQGFCRESDRYLAELLAPRHVSYRPRAEMEQDPGFKQLIPYAIFQFRGPSGIELFQYTRGKGQGEGRLHSKRSIGVGGHISSDDQHAPAGAYEEGMRRELDEEIAIGTTYTQRCVGLINDDLTEVGKVHLGVVHLFEVDEPHVLPREADLVESGFRPLEAIRAERDRLETWSQICLDALFGKQ